MKYRPPSTFMSGLLGGLMLLGFPGFGQLRSNLAQGFEKNTSGVVVEQSAGMPEVQKALISRCFSGKDTISWTTAPAKSNQGRVTYIWLAGFATGKNRQNSGFDLYAGHQHISTISVTANKPFDRWTINGESGSVLNFVPVFIDDNKDSYGFIYLSLPVAANPAGKGLELSIIARNTNRYDDWCMTFMRSLHDSVVSVATPPLLRKKGQVRQQPVTLYITSINPDPVAADVSVEGQTQQRVSLTTGWNEMEVWVPAVDKKLSVKVSVTTSGLASFSQEVTLKPVVYREIYLVNHSHNDIGYSNLQDTVARQQNDYIRAAMAIADSTNRYPEGERFVWNVEALWAVENFMSKASAAEKESFIAHVRAGSICLPAGYANLLTGVSSPEELIHWTDYADSLRTKFGFHTRTAMVSDVPGFSWKIVSALAQRGIRYVSSGPNYIPHDGFPDLGGRVGATHRSWGDKPFYWLSASGKDTVLYWQAGTGYSWFQDWNMGRLSFHQKPKQMLLNYVSQLQEENYPYDMVQARYAIINDNCPPDEHISAVVKEWNEHYASPKLVISGAETMMSAFEKKYRARIPLASGDFTPYWEDGVMSTAREEVMSRRSSERLYQAEVLHTLIAPGSVDNGKFYDAWRDIVLWHEHTWGAHNSIAQPDDPFVKKQWAYKQQFAKRADSLSRMLLQPVEQPVTASGKFPVINTSSWKRTGLVTLDAKQSAAGDIVMDERSRICPSQRLHDGQLVFLATDVPALGRKMFIVKKGRSTYTGQLQVSDRSIQNEFISLTIDEQTGCIKSLIDKKTGRQLVDTGKYAGLNQYLYVAGRDPAAAATSKVVSVSVMDKGPLFASLVISAQAPGSNGFTETISLVDGDSEVRITNEINKSAIRNKESLHFAFPVHIPAGTMHLDAGTGVVQPEKDLLNGANKDYFPLYRWLDVSDSVQGFTFISPDIPLVEKGEMINELPIDSSNSFGGISGEKKWKEKISQGNTFFSYVMNNYWYTNYKADQEGLVRFQYTLSVHAGYDAARSARMAAAEAQPLLVSINSDVVRKLPFSVDDEHILLTAAHPSASGKGYVLRFYNASSDRRHLTLINNKDQPKSGVYVVNASEEKLERYKPGSWWPPFSIRTLLIETDQP